MITNSKIGKYGSYHERIMQYVRGIDWSLFLFLVLVLNVKLIVKAIAILFFTFINRKHVFEKRTWTQRFLWFYASMIALAVVNLLIFIPHTTINYFFVVLTGVGSWGLCLLTALLLIMFVKNVPSGRLHATVRTFFLTNAIWSVVQLVLIVIETGHINPYTYQGLQQKYFINTGDFITGLSFDTSTTNALINAFAIIYFLLRNQAAAVILCMTALLLTVSNFTNIVLTIAFLYLLLFYSSRIQKSIMIVCIFMFVIFLAKISPQNNLYLQDTYERISGKKNKMYPVTKDVVPLKNRPDNILTVDERKQKIALLYLDSMALVATQRTERDIVFAAKPGLPREDIHSKPYQRLKDSTPVQKMLISFAFKQKATIDTSLSHTKSRRIPGKIIAFRQTLHFFSEHPQYLASGTGTGNFSSKLAFRATGLQIAGGYPQRFTYINECFLDNHLALYLDYFSKDAELHSLTNSPDSVYDQLLSEYGLLGLLAFIVFYAGYFLKQRNAFPFLIITGVAFFMGYWFEQLSIVIIFELLMLMNKKDTTGTPTLWAQKK